MIIIEHTSVIEDDEGICFELSYTEKLYIMIILYSWYFGGEQIHISIMNKLKVVIFYLWMLHMVCHDHLDQELGQNLLEWIHLQVEELIPVKKTPIHVPVNKYELNFS